MTQIKYLILASRQGKIRLVKWYAPYSTKEKQKVLKELTPLVLARKAKMCNIVEYSDHRVMYRRYASLFFICGITPDVDNELLTLEVIHRYVETMDSYFGNVCELDIIFNFSKAYDILNEILMCDGSMAESSKKEVLQHVMTMDTMETNDNLNRILS